MIKVRHSNYYQQKLQNNYFQPKVLLLAQPLSAGWDRCRCIGALDQTTQARAAVQGEMKGTVWDPDNLALVSKQNNLSCVEWK